MDGWKTSFLSGSLFSGAILVSGSVNLRVLPGPITIHHIIIGAIPLYFFQASFLKSKKHVGLETMTSIQNFEEKPEAVNSVGPRWCGPQIN